MIYGYARVSTPTQDIQRQIRNIKAYDGSAIIFQETYTGTKQNRPEWLRLMKKIKPHDTIIFDSVSRMSRSAEDGFCDYEKLYKMNINLIFLKERHIDTATYKEALNRQLSATGNEIADPFIEATNKVLMLIAQRQIKLAFEQAEKEVADLHVRTAEGIQTAKLNGKQIGRAKKSTIATKKSIEAKKIIQRHSIDFGGSLTDKDVMTLIGNISRNSFYKYKRELKNDF